MINAILGFKEKQTQIFNPQGERVPVTQVKTGPCFVVRVKDQKKDGYTAVQLGLGNRKETKSTKPFLGHIKKAGLTTIPLFLREIRLDKSEISEEVKAGVKLQVSDLLKSGDIVDVVGISKGKGFAGVVKRWGFAGGPRTHGQSDRERAPGSIGSTTTPGRVLKGKHMAGRMGGARVTVRNLEVVGVDSEKESILLKGSVPGPRKGILIIKKKRK